MGVVGATVTVKVHCPPCPRCGEAEVLDLSNDELRKVIRWQSGVGHIQNMFPEWSAEKREMLKTGFHPACWDLEFGGDE